ncbi:penicillin-binding protein 2 [Candidatus Parcubacteria bacterium]|nr:MAG: penicillin-binding protein 2 [Candidatus Parcubacteria bacterium]
MAALRSHQTFHWRLAILAVFFLVLLAALVARVFSLSIIDHRQFALAADRQHQLIEILPSRRGAIYAQDKSGQQHPLAVQQRAYTVVAVPKNIADAPYASEKLAEILGIKRAEITAKLAKEDDPYEIIARRIDEAAAERIRALGMPGVSLVEEARRSYPQEALGANLLGFISYRENEEQGEYGLEREYDGVLKGARGLFEGEKDAKGYWVALGRRILNPPVDGDSLVLTIDSNIQYKAEAELAALMERWQAEQGLALVIEPKTGRILAAAAAPSFNPNEYSRVTDYQRFRLPIVDAQYELGSVLKPITMAAALDAGAVTPKTTYEDTGAVKFGTHTIRNFDGRAYGVQTMSQVIEKSLNVGAVFAQQKLGQERFKDYLRRFGFGTATGVDFPNEVAGNIANLDAGRDIDYATAAFGQGIAVTPLQIASAIGAIANDGVRMKPYIVERIIDSAGNEEVREPVALGRAIEPTAADAITDILVATVEHSFESKAEVDGYRVAGKTGTAQIPLPSGRGYSEEYIHSFVGFAPASDPRFLAFFQLVRPQGNIFASNTLTPAFHNLAEFILAYYDVPPDAPGAR